VLKHVIVERPKPDAVDRLEDLAMELRAVTTDRSWVEYRAWKAVGDVDAGEPPLFDVGILDRVSDAGPTCSMPGSRTPATEVRFHGGLGRDGAVSWHVPPTVKDAVGGLGVPHTEVGRVLVYGREVALAARLVGGTTLEVRPHAGPRPRPPGPTCSTSWSR
jgi:hypothetical protein